MSHSLISRILSSLEIPHTESFVDELSAKNIQGGNLFGITRLLEVFGVKSRGIRIEDGDDIRGIESPFIAKLNGKKEFVVVTAVETSSRRT